MADVEKILKLVAEGALTAQEADEILAALEPTAPPTEQRTSGQGRHLRIQVSEHGKNVVNLRIPMNLAGWASSFLPGLSDENTQRIRAAMATGERGPLIDIDDQGGSRVLIVSE